MENLREVMVLSAFHVLGTILELFKTSPQIGSWSYPEPAFFRIGTVPLYSGFMYSAVSSYMNQAWKVFSLRLENVPLYRISTGLAGLAYLNFFTHHYIGDFRWVLLVLIIAAFWQARLKASSVS